MKSLYAPFLITILLSGLLLFSTQCSSGPKAETNPVVNLTEDSGMQANLILSREAVDLRVEMRKLWDNQVVWSRQEILSMIDNVPGGSHAHQRLLQNQEDIAHIIRRYYGYDPATRVEGFLKENVNLVADVIKAIKAKDNKLMNAANRKWFVNADSIAVILSNHNPNYGKGELKLLLHEHLRDITEMADARLKKDYDKDVRAYDTAHEQALKLGDVLTEGIVHHFPEKFD